MWFCGRARYPSLPPLTPQRADLSRRRDDDVTRCDIDDWAGITAVPRMIRVMSHPLRVVVRAPRVLGIAGRDERERGSWKRPEAGGGAGHGMVGHQKGRRRPRL